MDQADFPGDAIGYINFAPFLIGTPVIDTYKLELAVPDVDYAYDGAKRKIGVCRGEGFGVEALAIGGFSALLPRVLPTCIIHPALNPLSRLILYAYRRCFPA